MLCEYFRSFYFSVMGWAGGGEGVNIYPDKYAGDDLHLFGKIRAHHSQGIRYMMSV